MENLNINPQEYKERHGCVTAWLIMMIAMGGLTMAAYLFASESVVENFPSEISKTMLYLLGFMALLNVIFCILLFHWKKIGFWGIVGTSICVLTINLTIGINPIQAFLGLVGVILLFGVLQFKSNDVSAWDNLE